jgi:hypothetical protein
MNIVLGLPMLLKLMTASSSWLTDLLDSYL